MIMAASGGSGGDDDDATTILSTTPTIVIDDQPDMSDDYNEHDDDDEIPRRLSQQLTIRKKSSYRLGDFLYSYWLRTRTPQCTGTDEYSYGLLLYGQMHIRLRIHVLVRATYSYGSLLVRSARKVQYTFGLECIDSYYSYGANLRDGIHA